MSGQSIVDRLNAAKHTVAGSALGRAVVKATTEEIMAPKRKHLDYLLQATSEINVSIPQMADLLIERTQNSSWVVTFKSLIVIHHLMCYGNERFSQYMASHSSKFALSNFFDKSGGVQGADMSSYIRKYATYLNEKRETYKLMGFDFCKVKRGKDDGMLRTMNAEKLIKAVPILHKQLETLIQFDVQPNELTNGVINACFVLLSKDLIRLFACYNDGIINLLEKYFDMNKKTCKEALDIYKKFLECTDRVSAFLKVAESAGMDKSDIPDLAKAPASLLEALENHLATLENRKTSTTGATNGSQTSYKPPTSVTNAITHLSSNVTLSNEEKRRVIEEEAKTLETFKTNHLKKQASLSSPTSDILSAPTVTTTNHSTTVKNDDIFSLDFNKQNTNNTNNRPSDDLLFLSSNGAAQSNGNNNNTINPFLQQSSAPANNPFQQFNAAPPPQQMQPPQNLFANNQFNQNSNKLVANNLYYASAAYNNNMYNNNNNNYYHNTYNHNFNAFDMSPAENLDDLFSGLTFSNTSTTPSEFDAFGDVLQPTSLLKPQNNDTNNSTSATNKAQTPGDKKILSTDLDSSLASLADNLDINYKNKGLQKNHQWTPDQNQGNLKTGGNDWKPMKAPTMNATAAPPPSIPITTAAPMWGQPPMGVGVPMQQPGWNTNPMMNSNPFAGPPQQPIMNMGQQMPRQPFQPQMPIRPQTTISSNSNNPFGF